MASLKPTAAPEGDDLGGRNVPSNADYEPRPEVVSAIPGYCSEVGDIRRDKSEDLFDSMDKLLYGARQSITFQVVKADRIYFEKSFCVGADGLPGKPPSEKGGGPGNGGGDTPAGNEDPPPVGPPDTGAPPPDDGRVDPPPAADPPPME